MRLSARATMAAAATAVCIGAWLAAPALGALPHSNQGIFGLLLKGGFLVCNHDRGLDLDVSAMKVIVVDPVDGSSTTLPLASAADTLLADATFDRSRCMVPYWPGYTENADTNTTRAFVSRVVARGCYVLLIDHSAYTSRASTLENYVAYQRSVTYVYYCGRAGGEFLAGLLRGGVARERLALVAGHSLGAHMAGVAGGVVSAALGGRLPRIAALDAAGPCFDGWPALYRVKAGSADRVDCYTSNAGGFGTSERPCDFHAVLNDGSAQPGCGPAPSALDYGALAARARCSHDYCVFGFTWPAALGEPTLLPALECPTAEAFRSGACAGNATTVAGYYWPGDVDGTFYCDTTSYDVTED